MENKKLYELDKALCFAEEAMEDIESAQWFLDSIVQSLENCEQEGLEVVPLQEVLVKSRGVLSLLNQGGKKLEGQLSKALEVSEKLNGFKEKKKA